MMELKEKNGNVDFILKAGKDFVKSEIPVKEAQKIIENATNITSSDKFKGFPMCVDDKFYFPTQTPSKNTEKKSK